MTNDKQPASSSAQQSTVTTKSSGGSSPDKPPVQQQQPRQQPAPQQHNPAPQARPKPPVERDARHLAKALLEAETKLGRLQKRPTGYHRKVAIQAEALYKALVKIYALIFATNWHPFSKVLVVPAGEQPEQTATKLAKHYIGGWMQDLYYCIRKSLELKDPEVLNQHFSFKRGVSSIKYDNYLVQLCSAIRPTTVHFTSEETMWIPYFADAYEDIENPFNIGEFYEFNWITFNTIISIMCSRKEFRMTELKTSPAEGRPIWLFDWYGEENERVVYSWFPQENNYSLEDVVLAVVANVGITQILAPVDWDIAQEYTRTVSRLRVGSIPRVRPRSFYGAIERRVIVQSTQWVPTMPDEGNPSDYDPFNPTYGPPSPPPRPEKKRKHDEDEPMDRVSVAIGVDDREANLHCEKLTMITIGDYVYDCTLSRNMELQDLYKILKMFVLTS